MKLIILASFIIFCSVLSYGMKKQTRQIQKANDAFWRREREANNVRKKPLDDLRYILVPMEAFPTGVLTDNERVQEYIATVQTLADSKIVNLTGFTNTDLKLTYGTANITVLSQYDENYTTLITTLQRWAKLLCDNGHAQDARPLLSYAVSIGSDIPATYYLLADMYRSENNEEAILELIDNASALSSGSGQIIVRTLQEAYL